MRNAVPPHCLPWCPLLPSERNHRLIDHAAVPRRSYHTNPGGSPLATAWKKKQAVTRMAARKGQQPAQKGPQSTRCSPAGGVTS